MAREVSLGLDVATAVNIDILIEKVLKCNAQQWDDCGMLLVGPRFASNIKSSNLHAA